MLTGLFSLPWWGYLLVALTLTHLTIVSVTIFLHRSQAHRSVRLHPLPAHMMRFWLWLTTGMVTKEWVAIHRKHHAFCDIKEDPHSPQVRGIARVVWQGAELYRNALSDQQLLERFGKGTPDDWVERNLYNRYPYLGISLMLVIDLIAFGALGLTIWAVQMIWIPFWAAGVINGLGHWVGYRNFETEDASRNLIPLGLLIGGEELHNNHHAAPMSARLSCRGFEFDIGWFYIRLLSTLGLARVREGSLIQKPVLNASGAMNRLQLLRLYGRQVILPTLKREARLQGPAMRQLFRRARWLLLREQDRLTAAQRARVQSSLSASERLAVVYDFQHRLRDIWRLPERSGEGLAHALHQWCVDARETGVAALEEFAEQLMRASQVQRARVTL
ncbi:Fatty acid desaturase [Marinobacterium lacunae]|uniref:Fatty acid desaturase n=1 Tax=Marinobacterium lacunae TaxID=1232683 RepID=A0A081FWG1_9GAMM|nr:fatty acid desaturase [Marinobacterium lacunae]KEA62866.1 Fatty acid desaturase [Marinobacterium lacunae]